MAINLKEGKTFEDAYGNVYENAYGVIDQCNGNKRQKSQMFVLEIYKDEEARTNGKKPIHHVSYSVRNEDFCTWFACDKISENHYKNAYSYVLTLRHYREEINQETGETVLIDLGLVWDDWEGDVEAMDFVAENSAVIDPP